MVWHFIGVYIINRTLHDRLEIRNFSSRVEKYFTRSLRSLVKYLSTLEEKFRISARPCNILYLFYPFSCFNPFIEFIIAKIAINKLCINLLSLGMTDRKPVRHYSVRKVTPVMILQSGCFYEILCDVIHSTKNARSLEEVTKLQS